MKRLSWTRLTNPQQDDLIIYAHDSDGHHLASGCIDEDNGGVRPGYWPGADYMILSQDEFASIPPVKALIDAVMTGDVAKAKELAAWLADGILTNPPI